MAHVSSCTASCAVTDTDAAWVQGSGTCSSSVQSSTQRQGERQAARIAASRAQSSGPQRLRSSTGARALTGVFLLLLFASWLSLLSAQEALSQPAADGRGGPQCHSSQKTGGPWTCMQL